MMTEQQRLIMGIRESARICLEFLNDKRARSFIIAKGICPDKKMAELRGLLADTLKNYDEKGNRIGGFKVSTVVAQSFERHD